MEDYEINSATLAIIPVDEETSMVYEEEESYVVKKSSNSIIKDSCEYYGSTYEGRCIGTKTLTGIKGKYPIIIEESRNIIFFPTTSIRNNQSSWIALNKIKKYSKNKNMSNILFKNDKTVKIDITYYTLENQILRANLLSAKLLERKEELHEQSNLKNKQEIIEKS